MNYLKIKIKYIDLYTRSLHSASFWVAKKTAHCKSTMCMLCTIFSIFSPLYNIKFFRRLRICTLLSKQKQTKIVQYKMCQCVIQSQRTCRVKKKNQNVKNLHLRHAYMYYTIFPISEQYVSRIHKFFCAKTASNRKIIGHSKSKYF